MLSTPDRYGRHTHTHTVRAALDQSHPRSPVASGAETARAPVTTAPRGDRYPIGRRAPNFSPGLRWGLGEGPECRREMQTHQRFDLSAGGSPGDTPLRARCIAGVTHSRTGATAPSREAALRSPAREGN